MGGQQGITGDLGAHLAVTQDEMREDREHRFTRRALDTPKSEPTQSDAHIVRVTGQASTAVTCGLVCELKAQGEEKGHHAFDKGLAIAQELQVGRFVVKINGDGAVVPYPFARLSHVSPLW